jgi:drug/metabolite transporter (DMT)-like permease
MTLRHGQAVWLMVAVTLMWSIAGVVTRQLTHAASFEVTFWRSLFTALSLMVILPLWRGAGVFRTLPWRSTAFWLSGVCWSIMFTAFMVALTLTTVGKVLVTMSVGPLFTAVMARVFIGHKLPRRTWVAVAIGGRGHCLHVWLAGAIG